jgi:hypothetical protein
VNKFIVLFCFVFFVSCKSHKDVSIPKEKLKNISEARLFKEIEENLFQYNTLLMKKMDCNVDFKGNKFSFKGSCFIRRDSQIVISVVPLMGIELFKICITPAQYTIIDRTKKQVIQGNIGDLKTKYQLDFSYSDIQNILVNGFFGIQCDNNEIKECFKKFKTGDNNKQYYLRSYRERKLEKLEKTNSENLLFFEYLIDPVLFRISNVSIREMPNDGKVEVSYKDFSKEDDLVFPHKISIVGKKNKETFEFFISFDQIEKDSNNEIGFKIPEKYSKIINN